MALFHPLKFMLASPAEDADEIIKRLGPEVWVEDKYDGIRAQLHKRGTEVRLFSRDLHDITGQFPEIVEAARAAGAGTASSTARSSPGRTASCCRSSASRRASGARRRPRRSSTQIPVIYVAFDALALGPGGGAPVEPLLREPLAERRRRLDALDLPLAEPAVASPGRNLVAAADARRPRGGVHDAARAAATRA